jgi:hypothetical protein
LRWGVCAVVCELGRVGDIGDAILFFATCGGFGWLG